MQQLQQCITWLLQRKAHLVNSTLPLIVSALPRSLSFSHSRSAGIIRGSQLPLQCSTSSFHLPYSALSSSTLSLILHSLLQQLLTQQAYFVTAAAVSKSSALCSNAQISFLPLMR